MALETAKVWLDRRMAKAEPDVVASLKKFVDNRYMTIIDFVSYKIAQQPARYVARVKTFEGRRFTLRYSRKRQEWHDVS